MLIKNPKLSNKLKNNSQQLKISQKGMLKIQVKSQSQIQMLKKENKNFQFSLYKLKIELSKLLFAKEPMSICLTIKQLCQLILNHVPRNSKKYSKTSLRTNIPQHLHKIKYRSQELTLNSNKLKVKPLVLSNWINKTNRIS